MMLASFKIKGSKVSLNGSDISGVANSLEVLIHTELSETLGSRLSGKTSTSIKHKAFFKESEIEELERVCTKGGPYSFDNSELRYQMDDVFITISKHEPIAGVVPVEISVSGEEKPTRKRLTTL